MLFLPRDFTNFSSLMSFFTREALGLVVLARPSIMYEMDVSWGSPLVPLVSTAVPITRLINHMIVGSIPLTTTPRSFKIVDT